MDVGLKQLADETQLVEPVSVGTPDDGGHRPPDYSANVTVTYGIHRGRYPIGGMTVRDARRTLQKLLNIDPSAVAVINGSPVEENVQISAGVTMLSFVKPSAMKG
jgi:hypothetical protein